ncbi:MAG: phosphoserine phosphatase RsbU/P [Verrucomicrobiota bacterium]|jgi:sigma-B regulation protein RsbU (phosphoserine phosphatase)
MKPSEQILVVDDDPASRKLLLRTLSRAGYTPRECAGGVEALALVRAEPPSLLLLDFDMPELDGEGVLKQLRADKNPAVAQIPTIMLTGHSGTESEVLCLEAGADDFVTKPINAAVLRARIETQLRLRSMRRQLQRQNDELEAWRRNLERDLAAARLTQQSLIPQKPPDIQGWEVAACYRPVIQVGGDIYGWMRMRDERTLFWIADATGHGASAALLTTLAKLLFQHGSAEETSPSAIMTAVNEDFRSIFGARSFMTAMCVALAPGTGEITVVGAGHPPLLIAREGGATKSVASSAPPLGLIEQPQFAEIKASLAPKDAFLLYTDGLYGSTTAEQRRFAPERLADLMRAKSASAQALLEHIIEKVTEVNGDIPLGDDVAALVVRRQ